MRLLAAAILFLAFAPWPMVDAQGSWSVDAHISVRTADVADYVWTIRGLQSHTALTLPIPDNSTFVEAREDNGRQLSGTVNGDRVTVHTGTRPFWIKWRLDAERDGPFSRFRAQVAADAQSAVTVSIALPEGWTLPGYRESDDAVPDASGRFQLVGPAYVEYLALPSGTIDEGPAPGIGGQKIQREARATIRADGTHWALTTTYDTDIYTRDWDVDIPDGAVFLAASTPFGPLPASVEGDVVRLRTPYPVGYHLGGRAFTVEFQLPAPAPHGGAFRQVEMSVRAGETDDVRVEATLAPGLAATGARAAGGEEIAPLVWRATGPLAVSLSFLGPPASDHVQFQEGRFVVDAPRALESAARATARSASDLLPSAADFVFDPTDTRPFYVSYTHRGDIFAWEQGFYSNGLNTISIRASTLENATDGAAHLVPVGVLVHEAAHGLMDRRLPDVPNNLSFVHEGLARLAETRIESTFSHEVIACQRTENGEQCESRSARPSPDHLERFHEDERAFNIAWHASQVPEGVRGELYDHSGLVFHAFDRYAPPGALRNVMRHLATATWERDDARNAQAMMDILLENAPGAGAQAILYPGREAAHLPTPQFRYCVGPLVAPGYHWEEPPTPPPGGCPLNGYGTRDASLPTPPPVVSPTPATPTQATPIPAPPRISPPVATTTSTPTFPPAEPGGSDPQRPGAIRDDAPGGLPFEIPGVSLLAVALLALVVAVALRRRP